MEQARRSMQRKLCLNIENWLCCIVRFRISILLLVMRDVVRALIDECRRENYPGELGMIFLLEPGSKQYRLAVQYGFPFGSNLQPMADSDLFH